MKSILKFVTCFVGGYVLVLLMRWLAPSILLVRVSILFLITFSTILSFYLWTAPKNVARTNRTLAWVLSGLVALTTLVQHYVVEHNLGWQHVFPTVFSAVVPFACGPIYALISRQRKPKSLHSTLEDQRE